MSARTLRSSRNENIHPIFKAMFDDMEAIYSKSPLPVLPDYMRTAETPNSDEIADLSECGFPVSQHGGD